MRGMQVRNHKNSAYIQKRERQRSKQCKRPYISLHVAMAGTVPSIPPSVALKYSELMLTNRELTQQQNELSLVVPPSTRAIYAFSRQLVHDVRADAEELGLAGAAIDEAGLVAGTPGNTNTMPATITSLMCELGGQVQPSSGGYTNMDVTQFRAGRAFTDALSVVGKPSAMRGTTWDFIDWCGKKSVNGRSYPAAATGRRGTGNHGKATEARVAAVARVRDSTLRRHRRRPFAVNARIPLDLQCHHFVNSFSTESEA